MDISKTGLKSLKYPFIINWEVVAPEGGRLSILEDHDLILEEYDLKIRKLI